LAGCAGSENGSPHQAQASPQARAASPAQALPQESSHPLPPSLAPRYVHSHLGSVPQLVEANLVGHTARYVVRSDTPALLLKSGVTGFLYDLRFGEKGRPMVVRLLDGKGRSAWAAGYDGVKKTWVRTRRDLAACGPIWDSERRRITRASGAADAPPCRVEAVPPRRGPPSCGRSRHAQRRAAEPAPPRRAIVLAGASGVTPGCTHSAQRALSRARNTIPEVGGNKEGSNPHQ
jgi:hypothetical protein